MRELFTQKLIKLLFFAILEKTPSNETTPDAAANITTQGGTNSYSLMLSITIVIGVSLLILNICVFLGLYRQVKPLPAFRVELITHSIF